MRSDKIIMKSEEINKAKKKNVQKWPKVGVIILNWNGWKDTIECLESLKKITYPNYEVVVIDNGSKGNDADILRKKYKNYIKMIKNKENLGFTGGNNVGIKYAINGGSDYVLLLNNDTVVDPDLLTELIRVAKNDSKIGIIGPRTVFYNQPNKTAHGAGFINWWKGKGYSEDKENLSECEFVTGCTMLIKKSALEKLNYFFNNNYFTYYEDVDLCIRIKDEGLKVVYYPKVRLRHKVGASTGIEKRNPIAIYYYIRNRFLFMHKHASFRQKAFFFSAYLTVGVPVFILRSIFLWNKGINKKEIKFFLKAVKEGLLNQGGELYDSVKYKMFETRREVEK
jgi:GT2 family glycosyltransferase